MINKIIHSAFYFVNYNILYCLNVAKYYYRLKPILLAILALLLCNPFNRHSSKFYII